MLLMIDIDNFKQVNDFYGHLSGDVMLTEAARMLQDMFRASDILGRIGGDEFTVLAAWFRGAGHSGPQGAGGVGRFCAAPAGTGRRASFFLQCWHRLKRRRMVPIISRFIRGRRGVVPSQNAGEKYLCVLYPVAVGRAGAPTQSTVGQTIDSELGTGVMRSSLAEYVFHILYQSDDVEKAIPSVLEIVGRHVGVSRVYIF